MPLITEAIRAELVQAYAGPDRHYHGLAHIEALLALARKHRPDLTDAEAMHAAIWFHDAVYDTRRHDNEERSAELAIASLQGTTTDERLARIATMIRATAKHMLPDVLSAAAASDCALFLDMDLAILGAAPDDYDAYASAVRREYAWVSEPLWIEGRRKVLKRFLARPTIYLSPPFRTSHEAAARHNLARELATLA
jgi:predicted metal-dependent HD superfamily phosphohydrolase